MSTRDEILKAVEANQPALVVMPDVPVFAPYFTDKTGEFTRILQGIGATVYFVDDYAAITEVIKANFTLEVTIATTVQQLLSIHNVPAITVPHDYENIELAVVNAAFGVAENGAVWLTEEELPERVLPFIPQHLAVVLQADDLVATMHDAYQIIGAASYGWGAFIAGPSKTADIEQSLVLGAHGPRTMTLFVLKNN